MAAVAMALFLGTINGSIVNVALPTLVRDLQADFPTTQWVILIYLLVQATLMPSIGRLGDMLGKKAIFIAGFVVFTVGSILCGLAPTIYWLIAFRVIQAIGAAMTLTLAFALITEAFPPHERGKALGLNSTIVSVGVVIGPTIGGVILDVLTWHWLFFVAVPVGIIGIFIALRYIPDFRPEGRQTFDYAGAVTLFISLTALLLALTLGQRLGFGSPLILWLLAGWIIFLAMFIAIEWRTAQPMIEPKLLQNQRFSLNLTTRLLTFVSISGTIILIPFYLEDGLGYSTRQVGLLLTVTPICLGIISPISGALSDRFGSRLITTFGLIVLIIGYYTLSTLDEQTSTIGYILRLLPVGVGMGIFQAPNNSDIMGAVPLSRSGIASGLISITRTMGQTAGVAALGALWAARTIYHYGANLPGGVTTAPVVSQIAGLQDTFFIIMLLAVLALVIHGWGLTRQPQNEPVVPRPVET
jgi:EmrB/QacA subfamily drug resistance transporter